MRLSPALAVLLVASTAQASERHVLPNGLVVIIEEDHRLPRAAVLVDYDVGAADDPAGMEGLAHLSEHALFLGSPAVGRDGHYARLTKAGAWDVNGFTAEDHTIYQEVVPTPAVDLALWLEAQRMAYGLLGVDDEGFEREQGVVTHEHRLRENAYRMGDRGVWRLLLADTSRYFPADGPEQATDRNRDDVLTFVQSSYAPDAAVLVVVGDVSPPAVMTTVERYFGAIRRSASRLTTRTEVVPRAAPGSKWITGHTTAGIVVEGWLGPAAFAPGDAALDVAAAVLQERLEGKLVKTRGDALVVQVMHPSLRSTSLFEIRCIVRKGVNLEELAARIADEVQDLARSEVSEAELQGARAWELRRVLPGENVLTRATQLASYQRGLGNPDRFVWDRERLQAVDAPALREAALHYLRPDRRATVFLEPP